MIKHYCPEPNLMASSPPGYFIYKGIKVTTPGKAEELETYLNTPMIERLNKDAGRIPGTKTRVKVLSRDSVTTLEVER